MFWSGALVRAGLLSCASSLLLSYCGEEVHGPPCFNASYRVQFVERLPKSDCPNSMVDGWSFDIEPVAYGASGTCSPVDLRLLTTPPRTIRWGVTPTGIGFTPGLREAGGVVGPYEVEDDSCSATTMMVAFIPDKVVANVEEAIAQDTVVWGATTDRISEGCGVPVPEHGYCTDYYRATMTKLADWKWE